MLVDLHAHIHFNIFKDDADEVIRRAQEAGVFMVAPSTKLAISRRAIEFGEKYRGLVFPAIGLHPIHTKPTIFDPDEEEAGGDHASRTSNETFEMNEWLLLAKHPLVVAIGETGLDYVKRLEITEDDRKHQENILRQQLELALEVTKPVILHCRDGQVDGLKRNAHQDMLAILKEYVPRGLRGVSHCFSGNKAQAQEYMQLGFGLSFTGMITYNGAWDRIIKDAPLYKLFTETDSPYLTPVPHRDERNEPVNVKYVVEHISGVKNTSFEEVAEQTVLNAKKMFNLPIQ